MTSEVELASQILVIVGQKPDARLPSFTADELFQQATRKQLLDCAQTLGLTGVSKLVKEELADRVKLAFDGLRAAIARNQSSQTPVEQRADGSERRPLVENGSTALPIKFHLGPEAENEPMPQNIPWGYDQNRVTAMIVDPERLYVYWEITDDGFAAARKALGGGGAGAWLNLRVYDITGRLFDGTNAHSYFDHRIERHDRQWFFAINKPTSAACVEVGLKSDEGYFVRIARSGRVEFPRREPAPGGAVEWLTVRAGNVISGHYAQPGAAAQAGGATGAGGGGGGGGAEQPAGAGGFGGWPAWSEWKPGTEGFPVPVGHRAFGRRWEWQEAGGTAWTGELTRTEWIGPLLRTEWESGPFTYPLEVPSTVEVHDGGEMSVRTEHGRVHIAYGPWQVVIRGLGGRAQRRVLGTWEYRRQVAVSGGTEKYGTFAGTLTSGSSEWMALGASEKSWLGSSELLFRGASELWMMGASETRLGGASELMFGGATERRMRGASELMYAGATERLFRGASERITGGASEQIYAGASERLQGGASERMMGASERALGASERMLGGSEGRLGTPSPTSAYPLPQFDRSSEG